jgi:hypothetical protein
VRINKTIIKIIYTGILPGALFFCEINVFSQDSIVFANSLNPPDSSLLVNNDTIKPEQTSFETNFTTKDTTHKNSIEDSMRINKHPSPNLAGLYSAIIPGLGQAYNHKYWKIPFIYAGGGILIYYVVGQNNFYKDFKKKYEEEYFKPPEQQNGKLLENYGLNRDIARKNRDRLLLFTGLVYAANIVDAIVDAYFSEFDISDDLSMKLKPAITYPEFALGNFSYGFSMSLNF